MLIDSPERDIQELIQKYGAKISPEEIRRIYNETMDRWKDSSVKQFIRIFALKEIEAVLAKLSE